MRSGLGKAGSHFVEVERVPFDATPDVQRFLQSRGLAHLPPGHAAQLDQLVDEPGDPLGHAGRCRQLDSSAAGLRPRRQFGKLRAQGLSFRQRPAAQRAQPGEAPAQLVARQRVVIAVHALHNGPGAADRVAGRWPFGRIATRRGHGHRPNGS